MKSAFVFIIFLVSLQINGQKDLIDSLERELIQPTNGMSKIELLNELSWYYAQSDAKLGIERADLAIDLARQNDDSLNLGIAYERKGYNYQNLGEDSLTITYYNKAQLTYELSDNGKRLAALTFNKANFYLFRSDYLRSLEYGTKALSIYKDNKDSTRMSRAYNQIALNQMYLGNYTQSTETFQKGLLLLKLTKEDKTQFYAQILENQALLNEKLSKLEKALMLLEKALTINKKINYPLGISTNYANMGKLYGSLNQHDKSIEMLTLSMDIKESMGNKYRIANGRANLGVAYAQKHDYPNATINLLKAKVLYEELEHYSNLSTVYRNMGDIYLDQNLPQKALPELNLALNNAKKSEDKRAMFLAKESKSKAFFQLKDYQNAYVLLTESSHLRDSLLSSEKRDEISKIEAKYEFEKDKIILEKGFEKDRAISAAEIKSQIFLRNLSIGSGLFTLSALIFGFILIKQKREASYNAKIIESELQKLRAQLNPHFIFNTLNSINDFIRKNEKELASSYLNRFSKMMRTILDNSGENEVQLDEEIEFLENYIKLEQARLENKFTYSIILSDDIKPKETLVPPLLLQPFIENSIWHGLSPLNENEGKLTISIYKKDNILMFHIDDNGVGMNTKVDTTKNEYQSFGAKSAQNRLDLLNQLQGHSVAKVEFIEKEKGVGVEISLPLFIESHL